MAKSKSENKEVAKKGKTSSTKKTTTKKTTQTKKTTTKTAPKKVEKKSNVIFFLLKVSLLLSACYGLGYLVGKVVGNLFIK